jgi:hypothetical protein
MDSKKWEEKSDMVFIELMDGADLRWSSYFLKLALTLL